MKAYVYEVTSTALGGTTQRYLPLFADRAAAKRFAALVEDKDERYIYNGRGRWRVDITRLPVEYEGAQSALKL